MATKTDRVRFEGALGERLAARLELPDGEPRAFALFAHCFTCSKDLKAVVRISRALAERGIGVFRFDFTGLGESEGDFADTDFSSNLEDLVAAASYLGERWGGPEILVGHSLGGVAVLAAAKRVPSARLVATIGAPSDTDHLRRTLLERAPELADAPGSAEAEIDLAGRRIRVRRQLLDDLARQNVEDAIGELGLPLLIFHSPVDQVVGIDHARRIYQAAKHPKSFVSLDGADHLLLDRPADARFVGEVLSAWASRFVDAGEVGERAEDEAAGRPGEVVVTGGASGFANRIASGRHRLRADEPASLGGTDTGPSPYELLLAALGACKSMTLRMYADRKGWPLEGVEVRLAHSKVHAKDCAECETKEGKIDRIEVGIEVEGPLDEEQRRRLLEIADRCPVHRTLVSEIEILSR